LPRPPAWICALTTVTGVPSEAATFSASSGLQATPPFSTATPYFARTSLAWYSWMFIAWSPLRRRSGPDVKRTGASPGPEAQPTSLREASISSRTEAQLFSKAAFSASFSAISTMRSTPPAPITTGTPT
jgi:hypothetical protein